MRKKVQEKTSISETKNIRKMCKKTGRKKTMEKKVARRDAVLHI